MLFKIAFLFIIVLSSISAQDNVWFTNQPENSYENYSIADENQCVYSVVTVIGAGTQLVKYDSLGQIKKRSDYFSFDIKNKLRGKGEKMMAFYQNDIVICSGNEKGANLIIVFDTDLNLKNTFQPSGLTNYSIMSLFGHQDTLAYILTGENGFAVAHTDNPASVSGLSELGIAYSVFFTTNISMDVNGDILLSKTRSDGYYVFDYYGNIKWSREEYGSQVVSNILHGVFYTSDGNKYDINQNTVTPFTNPVDVREHLLISENGDLLIAGYKDDMFKYAVLDSDGNVIAQDEENVTMQFNDAFSKDNYFYLNKKKSGNINICKMSAEGGIKGLQLYTPKEAHYPHETIDITFESAGIEFVDLAYTQDFISWFQLGTNIPVYPNSYSWTLPESFSQIYIKISESGNPDYNIISTNPIKSGLSTHSNIVDINNVKMWVSSQGAGAHNPKTDDSGLSWDGTEDPTLTSVFSDGPVFGFKINDSAKVYAAVYREGFSPGKFLEDGSTTDEDDSTYVVYKAQKDWELLPESYIKFQLEYAHNHWPVEDGAPFVDNNGNGTYEPLEDTPDYIGDQVLWWVNHTNNPSVTQNVFGSSGDKLDIRTTVWAAEEPFADVVYKQYLFINHDDKVFKDFYFGYWSDPDVGNASDDFSGFDENLNLAFTYNGDDYDDNLYMNNPASVGYLLLDGPVVPGVDMDTARFNRTRMTGAKNLEISAFNIFINGSSLYNDPILGYYDGSVQMYKYLQGKFWNGEPFINPITNDTTKIILNGDPVNHTGWYEGEGWPNGPEMGDRRMLMSAGPFDLAPGDTNCVTIAILNARGPNRLESLTKLKRLARQVRNEWIYGIITEVESEDNALPEKYSLAQNYPNPFNPVTTIEFSLPEQSNVKLEVFNILGEKVTELVNTQMKAGTHKVNFDASALSSGVYLYCMKAGKSNLTRKMVVLK